MSSSARERAFARVSFSFSLYLCASGYSVSMEKVPGIRGMAALTRQHRS